MSTTPARPPLRQLPRNVWIVTITSFLTDISSEMVLNLLPLFLANVLGVRTNVIGLIEGLAERLENGFQPLFFPDLPLKLEHRQYKAHLWLV